MTTNLLPIFNDHFSEFVNDIHSVFPDDTDILTAKQGSYLILVLWIAITVGRLLGVLDQRFLTKKKKSFLRNCKICMI